MRSLMLMFAICASGCGCGARTGVSIRDAAVSVADSGRDELDAFVPDASLVADGGTDADSDAGPSDAGSDASCPNGVFIIDRDPEWTRSETIYAGLRDAELTYITLENRSDATRCLGRLLISASPLATGAPADCLPDVLGSARLWPIGYESPPSVHPDGRGMHWLWLPWHDVCVPRGETWRLGVFIDTMTMMRPECDAAGAEFTLSTSEVGIVEPGGSAAPGVCVASSSGLPLDVISLARLTFYQYRLRITTMTDSTELVPGGPQEVARYLATNLVGGASPQVTIRAMDIDTGGIFPIDARPRTLRLYRDAVVPANLLFERTFPDGMPPAHIPLTDAEFPDVLIGTAGATTFIATVDTDGFARGATFGVGLENIRWSDGAEHTGVGNYPPVMRFVRFAP